MEYLYFSSGTLSEQRAIEIFNARRLSFRRADACHSAGAHGLVANGPVARDEGRLFALFGTAFVGNRFLNNFAPRTEAETVAACREIAADPACASGTFTAILADLATGDAEFFLDDLNSAPCFIVRHSFGFAVSSNVHMLADWLAAQGVTPTRTIEPALSHLVFSSGLTTGNLYREIRMMQPEERPAVRKAKLEIAHNDPIWPRLLAASYEELIAEAAEQLRRRIRILTDSGEDIYRVFDVTGGMDSRIVLAAIVGSGAIGEWRFHNYREPSHPDSNFAHFVAEKWGIRQWPREKGRVLPPLPRALLELYLSFGTELKSGTHYDQYRPSYLHLTGAFGELGGKSMDTKRFQGAADRVKAGAAGSDADLQAIYLDAFLDRVGIPESPIGFTPAMQDWARRATSRQIDLARAGGVSFDQMPVVFYQRGKARSHFGVATYLRGMREQAAGILNTPYLTAAAVKIGAAKSRPGRVHFDLIRKLGGDEVAGLPLVNDTWARELFDSDDEARRFQAPPVTAKSDMLFREPARPDQVPDAETAPLRPELWDRARFGAAALAPQSKHASPLRQMTGRLVGMAEYLLRQGPASDEVAAYLPDASVWNLILGDPADHGPVATVIHTLQFFCQAEMWMRGMEEAPFPA